MLTSTSAFTANHKSSSNEISDLFVKRTLEIRQDCKWQKTIGAAEYRKIREASYVADGDRKWVNHLIKIGTDNDFGIMIF